MHADLCNPKTFSKTDISPSAQAWRFPLYVCMYVYCWVWHSLQTTWFRQLDSCTTTVFAKCHDNISSNFECKPPQVDAHCIMAKRMVSHMDKFDVAIQQALSDPIVHASLCHYHYHSLIRTHSNPFNCRLRNTSIFHTCCSHGSLYASQITLITLIITEWAIFSWLLQRVAHEVHTITEMHHKYRIQPWDAGEPLNAQWQSRWSMGITMIHAPCNLH